MSPSMACPLTLTRHARSRLDGRRIPLAAVEAVLARAAPEPASLLPVLHAVQEALGHVPPEAAGAIGRAIA